MRIFYMSGFCLDNFRVPRDIEILDNMYFWFVCKGKGPNIGLNVKRLGLH